MSWKQRRFRILFVDDEAGTQETVRRYLPHVPQQWDIVFAATRDEAEQHVNGKTAPDAVILDLNLEPARRAGLELLAAVRKHHGHIPVIAISDDTDTLTLHAAYEGDVVTDDLETDKLAPDTTLLRSQLESHNASLKEELEQLLLASGRVSNETAVLITHGTDTMAWGFAYLQYAVNRTNVNIAITGSQTPLQSYFSLSDALGNLKTAVYLLNRVRPPKLFVVFNEGHSVYSSRLHKLRKWDADAFIGQLSASSGPDEPVLDGDGWIYIPYDDQILRLLWVIRTGGTIESETDEFGALRPSGDYVNKYLAEFNGKWFYNSMSEDPFALDSSNMSLEEWATIANTLRDKVQADVDIRFATVRPILANPFFTCDDYLRQMSDARGCILLGYGAGNANTSSESSRSILPAIERFSQNGGFIAVTSQVPIETYDVDYATGRELLIAGGIPCGDLSFAHAQIKLSYLLGHIQEIESSASAAGLSTPQLFIAAFLAGVNMRRKENRKWYLGMLREKGMPIRILPDDPFICRPFSEGLDEVIGAIRTAGTSSEN